MYVTVKFKQLLALALGMAILLAIAGAVWVGGYSAQTAAESEPDPGAPVVEQTPDGVPLPILMYHDILKSRTGTYTISPQQLEADFMYLKENGYNTVVTGDIIAFAESGTPLPDNPIMLTFDDGYFNNIYYAEDLLKKYDMRAVMFVVGAFCEQAVAEGVENPNYSYVLWERIAQMSQGGVWDVQSHSWDMHKINARREGVRRKNSLDEQEHIKELLEDLTQISQKLEETTGKPTLAFAYPYGALDDHAEELLKKVGYKISVCSYGGVSKIIAGDPDSLFLLRRHARTNRKSAEFLLNQN